MCAVGQLGSAIGQKELGAESSDVSPTQSPGSACSLILVIRLLHLGTEAAQSASPAEELGCVGDRSLGVATHHCFGPQEIVDWFNALRAARFHYLQVAFPGASDADVSGCPRATFGIVGWGGADQGTRVECSFSFWDWN